MLTLIGLVAGFIFGGPAGAAIFGFIGLVIELRASL